VGALGGQLCACVTPGLAGLDVQYHWNERQLAILHYWKSSTESRTGMKAIMMASILLLSICSRDTGPDFDLFFKIENQEIIKKSDLEKQIRYELNQYEEDFIGTGAVLYSGDLKTGIVQGKKDDTIFDILIAFRVNDCIAIKENPNSSFYRNGGTICREYILGDMYTTYKDNDTTCISAYLETFEPFKIDTLKNMLHKSQVKIIQQTSFEYCIKR
jgi:hypothetical protein